MYTYYSEAKSNGHSFPPPPPTVLVSWTFVPKNHTFVLTWRRMVLFIRVLSLMNVILRELNCVTLNHEREMHEVARRTKSRS